MGCVIGGGLSCQRDTGISIFDFSKSAQSLSLEAFNPLEAVDSNPSPTLFETEFEATQYSKEVNGQMETFYHYNGQVPGPTIRVKVGDTVRVRLTNRLESPTTIHWHGLKVPYAMDGVTWKAEPVEPEASFLYEFTVEQTGTFWYHPHFDTERQLDRGLYGILIVEEDECPDVPEIVMIFDDAGEHMTHDHYVDRRDHHGKGASWLINQKEIDFLELTKGQVYRLRILNASNVQYLNLRWPHIKQIGGDQGFLSVLRKPELVLFAPGDRAEFELVLQDDPLTLESVPYSHLGGLTFQVPQAVLTVRADTGEGVDVEVQWPLDGQPPSSSEQAPDIIYTLQGDPWSGEWLLSSESFPNIDPLKLQQGSTAILEVRNISNAEHPFHLHGLVFEIISRNGIPVTQREMSDTINIPLYERARLKILADNPGEWMAHCHILPHAYGGMMTVLVVE